MATISVNDSRENLENDSLWNGRHPQAEQRVAQGGRRRSVCAYVSVYVCDQQCRVCIYTSTEGNHKHSCVSTCGSRGWGVVSVTGEAKRVTEHVCNWRRATDMCSGTNAEVPGGLAYE